MAPLVAGVGWDKLLLSMQPRLPSWLRSCSLAAVVTKGCGSGHSWHRHQCGPSCQSATGAFLGLVHLRIALLLFVLGRAGCLNDGGIDQRCLGHHDACFGQPTIDGLEQLAGQLMLLQQVAEIRAPMVVRSGGALSGDNRANRRMGGDFGTEHLPSRHRSGCTNAACQ